MKKKVLIIEDNEKNRILERDLLEVAGFEMIEAEDGASGIDLAIKEKPDLIVMDLRLPDMWGSQAAESLRRDKATHDIPIVFVTASVGSETIQQIKNISKAFFIAKPINTRTFAQEIKRCLPGGSHAA